MKHQNPRRAIVLGASGLVGRECLRLLCTSDLYEEVRVVTRRDLGLLVQHSQVRQIIVDFDRLADWSGELVGVDVFCAFGSTIRKAGSQDRFREIDLTYPSTFCRMVRQNGGTFVGLVSSRGADTGSRFFYLRVKGELEQAIRSQEWPSAVIVRPSVIGGRRNESRFLERAAQGLLRLGPASVRTVEAKDIAAVMLRLAEQREPGTRIVESADIMDKLRR